MAESSEATVAPASLPGDAEIERAGKWSSEPFLYEGEDPEHALAPGTARRRALDAALVEIAEGHEVPSPEWRRSFSLVLGLERLLATDEPRLADGTALTAHQVDALSGTLAGLMALVEESVAIANGGAANGTAPDLSEEDVEELEWETRETWQLDDGETAGEEAGENEDDEELVEDEEELAEEEEEEPGLKEELGEGEEEELEAEDEAPAPIEDPNAARRFWFEHATGAGKSVAALGFVEASRTGGILILTHRKNLVDQFLGELRDRGYADRIRGPLLDGRDYADGPVTVETYQWFVRNASRMSDAYAIVICDEAHTALGEKTSASIRRWHGPVYIGMTATGALIARHVRDLFPTQTSRFDLAQAARRGVIAPLRCVRIPPGVNVRSLAKVPLRRGEVDQDFDQEELAALLDQGPFNAAVADLYRVRFKGLPGVVYSAGVQHAMNVAQAFQAAGINAVGVSGETPKRELAEILAAFERGEIDVLVNAMLLAEGWNSPRATVCMHLAPTASRRVYQQRVGRITRRHPGKEAGIVVDFVHPATTHDEAIVTLHSLLGRDVYRGGAIVIGPVRRTRGRRLRVERRVVPVSDDPERRLKVFEREVWRIAVEHLSPGEQHVWAALAGARATPAHWRRAKAMLHHDANRELRRRFLLTCAQRNRNAGLKVRALGEVANLRDQEAFDEAIEIVGTWPRNERREGARTLLKALAERRIGRRDQAAAWVWRLAEFSRDVHEEYAIQRWPETKRLLGLLVNSSGPAHGRNARRIVQSSRKLDRRLAAALLAAALAHSPEAENVLRGARLRLARKPSAVARELVRNFPKGRGKRPQRKRRPPAKGDGAGNLQATETASLAAETAGDEPLAREETIDGDVEVVDDVDEIDAVAGDDSRK